MEESKVYTFGPASGKKPQQVVVLLHGLGSNGQDLISLAPYYAESLPDAVFVSPDAPFPCDLAPVGFQWFSLRERTYEKILAGVQEAAPILDNFLDNVLADCGLTDKDLALVGFSQGTMMSLYTGPRRKGKIAGILGYSGALVSEQDKDMKELQHPPVCLIHGEADDVVPVDSYCTAKETLEAAGFDVSGHSTPGLYHNIDEVGIQAGQDFLKAIFSS